MSAKVPLAAGWQDQRWTLARIRDLVAARFGVAYTIPGIWYLLRCCGWTCQIGARRAIERDDGAVEVWKKETWPRIKDLGGWIVFEDECGQSMRPPRSRTWGRRGTTPVIRVRGGGIGHVSIAGLACYRPGHRSRRYGRCLGSDAPVIRLRSCARVRHVQAIAVLPPNLGVGTRHRVRRCAGSGQWAGIRCSAVPGPAEAAARRRG